MAVWRKIAPRGHMNSGLRAWLTVPDSLTRRLQGAGQNFKVRVVRQRREPSLFADVVPRQVWAREVVLELNDQPVIFAHTELSTASTGPLPRWMARLGCRSLGSLLFSHPGFVRSPIEYCRLDQRHPLYRRAAQQFRLDRPVWARRSWHRLRGESVLVTELYLPALEFFKLTP